MFPKASMFCDGAGIVRPRARYRATTAVVACSTAQLPGPMLGLDTYLDLGLVTLTTVCGDQVWTTCSDITIE